jgi:uncharacterized protein (TIGR03000 family)
MMRKCVEWAASGLSVFAILLGAVAGGNAQDPGNRQERNPYEAYYAPDQAEQAAHILLRVPDNAEVWFDGQKTEQTGQMRAFLSPPIDPGQSYLYQLRVRWMEEGRAMERSRRILLQAGDRIQLDFAGDGGTRSYSYGALGSSAPDRLLANPIVLPNPKVSSLSEQDPLKHSGPPGSNDPLSTGPGQG